MRFLKFAKRSGKMEDLIKRLSELGEENPAFDGLMLKLEMALNSNFSPGSLEEIEFESSWGQ
jgi:hypothetical protein